MASQRRSGGRSLQSQGVPVPANLPAGSRSAPSHRKSSSGSVKGTARSLNRAGVPSRLNGPATWTKNGNSRLRQLSPVQAADNATSGIGMLEAEFFVAIAVVILAGFASYDPNGNGENTSNAPDLMMSMMKRGTMTCMLFFVLAMVASGGPNAAKFSKAFGGLVVVAMLLTSPAEVAIKAVDNLIKNDWVSTDETGNNVASADSGTDSSSSSSASSKLSEAKKLEGLVADAEPALKIGVPVGEVLGNQIKAYLKEFPSSVSDLPSNLAHYLGF